MKKQKHFNNLAESIVLILLLLLGILFCGFLILRNPSEMTLVLITCIFLCLYLGLGLFFLFRHCFSYWEITETEIIGKKFLRKKITIPKSDILLVKRQKIPLWDCLIGEVDAYVVYSQSRENAKIELAIHGNGQTKKVNHILKLYGYGTFLQYIKKT